MGQTRAMKRLLLPLQLLISLTAFARAQVPTITLAQLVPGNSWTWSYFEGEERTLYSTERYQVTERVGQKVVFELWTKYAHAQDFTPSARLTVDLAKCAQAYRGQRRPFSIGMQGIVNGHWSSEVYTVPATAFEEKFNCNPLEYPRTHPLYATVYETISTPWGTQTVFQQRPKIVSQILSFYFFDHPELRGVALRKAFNADSPYEYAMELVEWSQESSLQLTRK